MQLFTPTASGSFIAGIGLNSLLWGILFKLNALLRVLRLQWLFDKERFFGWITRHKGLSLLVSETMNLAWHGFGQSAEGVLFAIGGTFVNVTMIFVVLPLRFLKKRMW